MLLNASIEPATVEKRIIISCLCDLTYILDITKLATMNIMDMRVRAEAAEQLLKLLANRHRLMVLCELPARERSVSELQAEVGLSQSALSQHLARLRADGFVTTRREAHTIRYAVASDEVARVIALLHRMFCRPDEAPGRVQEETKDDL